MQTGPDPRFCPRNACGSRTDARIEFATPASTDSVIRPASASPELAPRSGGRAPALVAGSSHRRRQPSGWTQRDCRVGAEDEAAGLVRASRRREKQAEPTDARFPGDGRTLCPLLRDPLLCLCAWPPGPATRITSQAAGVGARPAKSPARPAHLSVAGAESAAALASALRPNSTPRTEGGLPGRVRWRDR